MVMQTLRHAAFAAAIGAAASAGATIPDRFKVEVEHPGIYEVTWESLVAAGLDPSRGEVERVALSTLGRPAPVWLEDGGDGRFGPGDRLLFLGERAAGEHTTVDEYSAVSVYWLELGAEGGLAGRTVRSDASGGDPATARPWVREHVERDLIMGRFSLSGTASDEERWYWARLSVMDREPFEQVLDLADLDTGRSGAHLTVRIGLRGWSEPRLAARDAIADHLVEVRLGGRLVASGEWNGVDRHVVEASVPVGELERGEHRLALTIPKRTVPSTDNLLPDIVLLNWIELDYPATSSVARPQVRLVLEGDGDSQLGAADNGPLEVYTAGGVRYVSDRGSVHVPAGTADGEPVVAVRPGGRFEPYRIRKDRPSDLGSSSWRADYIMITHRSLLAETERLAEFHRERGLAVAVVDVEDVYDEFNHGRVHPRAIRDFLARAREGWSPPAPRFVLLAGDASWDLKNPFAEDSHYADWTYRPWETTSFAKNASSTYEDGSKANDRGLVPSYNYPTYQGHAASDNWFVCLEGDDDLPDMAIGRLPAATPEELRSMVDKVVAYVRDTEVGPWRRDMLFIANENRGFQNRMDEAADVASRLGYAPVKIYARDDEPVNEHHTERIVELMDRGLQMIQFLGHGGRYIWRTAPSDLKENRDLFTLEHLDRLGDTPMLPVVVSLTCYSAPFDHPSADSIGEKLVRIDRRGAIAVIGATWRNSPSPQMGATFLEELAKPGATIGEAVQRAKHRIASPMLLHLYNLLGDPAVPMALPSGSLALETTQEAGDVAVRGRPTDERLSGEVLVEWLDADGGVVSSERISFGKEGFRARVSAAPDRVQFVRAYAWDPERQLDALGWAPVGGEAEERVARAEAGAEGENAAKESS